MARPPPNLKVVLDKTHDFFAALEELTSQAVFVGIPSTNVNRTPEPGEKNPASNALIGYVMENGDPDKNIPARPFLVPAVKANRKVIEDRLRKIADAAMDAD